MKIVLCSNAAIRITGLLLLVFTLGGMVLILLDDGDKRPRIARMDSQNLTSEKITGIGASILKHSNVTILHDAKNESDTNKTSLVQSTLSNASRTIIEYGDSVGRQRRQLLDNICKKLGTPRKTTISSSLWKGKRTDQKPRLYYSDAAKLIVCGTPKCGSTQWRNMILLLDGILKGDSVDDLNDVDHWIDAWKRRNLWNSFPWPSGQQGADFRLNNYYRVITVREPLDRLVSAYKDKLETDRNSMYADVSKRIHQRFHNGTTGLATFEDFVDKLLKDNVADMDPHWKHYSNLCDPCLMRYNYIAKLETIYDDVTYITGKLGIDRKQFFNDTRGGLLQRRRNSDYVKYFQRLQPSKRFEIFKMYKLQYDMFGYPYPYFVKEKSSEI